MKKYLFLILFVFCLFLVGCGKNSNGIKDDLIKKINNLKSYQLEGKLKVVNNDDVFNYDVMVNYKDKDYYRVSLKNNANNHEQIILRNDDGVYVVTPSLNKSFKFQSDWPYNNSQAYLLKNIVKDIESDKDALEKTSEEDYIITSKVNFPNNPKLVQQKVTVDKNLMIKKVEILNADNISLMTFTVNKTNYKPSFDESFFEINSIINTSENNENNKQEETNNNQNGKQEETNGNNQNNENNKQQETNQSAKTSTIDDIIYPLYIPTGTALTGEEKVSKTDGERVILTFGGEKPFTLVEETTAPLSEFTVIPTYGEPFLLIDTVAALSNNSINWVSNGIEYYIVSDVMSQNELIEVAKSVNKVSVLK